MRFLEDHELPEAERKRREAIRASIADLQKMIEREWKHIEPELIRAVQEGRYEAEWAMREHTYKITARLRREIAYLLEQLPPYMELRADEILERVAR